jgi:hypothetical protein
MSLTSELAKPNSPITQYLRFVGAIVADAGRGAPWAAACKRLLDLDSIPTEVAVAPMPGANPAMVGSAFDYRLRYHLAPCETEDLVAWQGALGLTAMRPQTQPELARFFSNLNRLAESL